VSSAVFDASALAEYLLRTPRAPVVEAALAAASMHDVPALCDVEVASILRRALLTRRLTPHRATEAVADYLDLALVRHGHQGLLPRILELRDNFSAYDAAYVALAEGLGSPLVTGDAALARAIRGSPAVDVEVVVVEGTR